MSAILRTHETGPNDLCKSAGGNMMERLPGLGYIWTREERHFARRLSRRALATYHVVRAQHAELTGLALYEKIVEALAGVGAEAAGALIRAAERCFTGWPSVRGLTFRDVVHYLCFDGFTRSHGDRGWTRTSLRKVVDSVIPQDL